MDQTAGVLQLAQETIEMKIFFISLSAAALIHAAELPPKAQPGQGALLSAAFIYPLENRPTPQCHASTIVETKTGLVAAWFAGTREKHNDVGIRLSRLVDARWTASVEVATGTEGEDKDYPCWNPVLFQPKTGPLMLFYKVGPTPSTWWGVLLTSKDGGKTWGNRRKLGKGPLGHLLGPVKNKPVQLADGAILCPSSTEHDGWRVHFEITRDLGKTWQVVGPINDGKKFGAIQPSVLVHKNGDLQVMCRSRQRVVTTSRSKDGGRTWSPMAASPLPNPNAGTDAVTLTDGRQLIVYNHTVRGGKFPSSRNMLNVAVSADGKSWKPVLTLERAPGEYSYPAVIQTRDGKVHITYTWQRKTVKHAVLDSVKLK